MAEPVDSVERDETLDSPRLLLPAIGMIETLSCVTTGVVSKNFEQVLSSVEARGKVKAKEIREMTALVEGEATPPEEPDARIDISFVEKESSVVGRIIAIGAPVGGVALVALLGLLFYVAYSAGRASRRI